ncbi:MAG: DEAD/DEAH box helicase [Thermoplasmata archaeon]|nr:MAG: DEAD/DEAH box helicase [Thermoplasmata archaeon]
MKFEEIKMNAKFLEKTTEYGFKELTYIQEKCMFVIYKGRDVVGQAETGSGKTLAFCLPILDKTVSGKGIQALVLTPTRELCVQVTEVFQDFGEPLGIKTTSIYGGVSIEPQIENIRTSDIIVGTPGRILDHLNRRTIDFSNVRFLVLDETDRMLDMGFIDDVDKIIRHTSKKRQTLMFSATIYEDIHQIMSKYLRNPLIVKTQPYVDANKLKQVYYDIFPQNLKFSLLVHLLENNTPGLAIVFCNTRWESDIVARNLRSQGINAVAIHGGMSQHKRLGSLNSLKNHKTDVLVATDVAARGLDIKNVTHIYNYDVPKTTKEYIHRIGRTARAGENGNAVTLLTGRDHNNFRHIQREHEFKIERADMPNFRRVPFIRNSERRRKSFERYNKYSSSYRHTLVKSRRSHNE